MTVIAQLAPLKEFIRYAIWGEGVASNDTVVLGVYLFMSVRCAPNGQLSRKWPDPKEFDYQRD